MFERAARVAGDAEAGVMVTARHAMLAIFRGRYDEANSLIEDVIEMGRRTGLAETERLAGSLRGTILMDRATHEEVGSNSWRLVRRRQVPARHFVEGTAAPGPDHARTSGRSRSGAGTAPAAGTRRGPAPAGCDGRSCRRCRGDAESPAAAALYGALVAYRGRLVVFGGANTVTGPVSRYLGLLASTLGRHDDAVACLEEAVAPRGERRRTARAGE